MLLNHHLDELFVDPQSKSEVEQRSQELLERSIGSDADFRPDQWEAIESLVAEEDRVLLVQRTGWGKSTVYFISTKLLREQGHGPTLIISPLLALMRNQIQDAEAQLDLEAWTINSNNKEEWTEAKEAVIGGSCDLLLISPERLANPEFQEDVLLKMDDEFGLLVVDEAHCISDWGHDFRPDYRRIKRILQQLPGHIPVAATTATANDRVVDDVTNQVSGLSVIRGDLVRDSLRIQTSNLGSRARRLAWLAENIPDLPSSGIVYCLTTNEVETVSEWLNDRDLEFEPYHGGVDGDRRQELEHQLMENEVDGLVATNALGMGFNKPDLGWVIHFQRPPNLIRYYQEIGRAGRGLDEAFAVLLSGNEDDRIAEFFIEQAFPEPEEFEIVLSTLEKSDEPLYKYELLKRANISWKAASQCLDMLRVDNAIIRIDEGFKRTSAEWSYDHERIESVTMLRKQELNRIKEFLKTDGCLTRFIDDELDGSLEEDCGQCANCIGPLLPTEVQDEGLAQTAVEHYRGESWDEISPRYFMPKENGRSKIKEQRKPEPGRVLSVYGDPGYGELVSRQHGQEDRYSQELVDAAVNHIETVWDPSPAPTWVTAVPSPTNEGTVQDLARRIADGLGLEYVYAVEKVRDIGPQHELANSYQKRWNVEGAFMATEAVRTEPVLLVDDTVGSRWSFTEASLMLRDVGCGPVFPFALAERNRW
jgi:ATP-dependent DNA helicase RecQ